MAFGRSRRPVEPPVEPVAWPDVRTFLVTSEERPATPKRKKTGWGQRAVRVPKGDRDYRVNAPCAYLAPENAAVPGPSTPGLTLYEDPEARRLLCYVDAAREVGGERHHVVRDGRGEVLGTLRRIPPKRPFRHTWRIDQPGRPEIAGRNEWVGGGSATEAAGRVAVKAAIGLVEAVLDFGAEGGDQPSKPRTLEWTADGAVVMVSEGSKEITVKADWLDRRLAFAFALVGDR